MSEPTKSKRLHVICADGKKEVQLLGSEGKMGGGWGLDLCLYCPTCKKTWELLRKEEGYPAKFGG